MLHLPAPVQRVFHPVAVHFKGSGFYTTDYGKKKGKGAKDGGSVGVEVVGVVRSSESSNSSDSKAKDSSKKTRKSRLALASAMRPLGFINVTGRLRPP